MRQCEAPPLATLPFWRQLRWKLLLAFVALSIILTVLVDVVILVKMDDQAQQQVFRQLDSVAQLKQHQILRWLDDTAEGLDLLVTGPTASRLATFVGAPAAQAADQPPVNQILKDAVIDHTATLDGDHHFRRVFLYTAEGQIVAASDEAWIGRVVTLQPFFAASLAGQYIQPPYYAVGSGALTMVITHPLVSRTGRTVGVVAGELDLQTLGTIMIERNGLGESGETYLVSGENNYLLTPSRFAGYPPMQAYHSVGIDRALHGENGAGTYSDYRSPPVPVLGVYRWMPELQAALVAEVDIAEALAPAHDTRNTSIALTAIVTLLAALLGFYQAARLSHPIVALTEVATEIGRGRLDQRARVDQRNEIGILATVFNQMTGQLQEMQAGLEQRIAERTAELEHTLAELQSLTSKLEQRNHELQASLVERQKAEAAIRQLNADLERRVAERTADLSAANTDLARAARLKDEFLASTSHELRTPLTAVLGFSEALVEEIYGDLTVKQREALQAITESGKHLLGMINDILDLAKIGAGKLELTFEPVELAAIVQASLRLTSQMARKKKLHVVSSIDSSVSVLYTDTRCLKQILVNLLSNAVKFTPVGGAVGLDIVGDAARRVVHCTVWDTGIGIAQADQAQIFQPFVQIDGRLSRQYAGTGLGLALVARMVNLLGGSITVSSIVGEGSRFTLTLPWNETAEARREMTDVPTGVREHAGPPDPPARQ